MKSWLSNWKNRRKLDVEVELKAARPEASARFVKSIAARLNPRPAQPVRTRTRLGLAAAVSLTMLAVVGATGGFSYAASGIASATHSVTHFSAPSAKPPAPPTTHPGSPVATGGRTSAGDEYTLPPTISSFSPTFGKVGTSVTVSGTNFAGASSITSVQLAGMDAGYTINSSTSLTFTVPDGASSGAITVSNESGSPATSLGSFTVVVAPTISSTDVSEGGGGTPVTITGTNFTGATKVTFNNLAASFSVASDTEIDATVPATAPAKVGGTIVVTNPAGSSSPFGPFTVLSGAPVVTKFAPAYGKVGDTITLSGKNFSGLQEVDFNGVAGDNAVLVGGTTPTITVDVPHGATTGPITVINDKGSGASKGSFLVVGAPVIDSFSPTAGKAGTSSTKPGTPVTISGSAFTGTTSVMFNGVSAAFKVKSDTQITTAVPFGASGTGPITITNATPTPTDSSDDFTVLAAVPSPNAASNNPGGAGTDVVITGTDLGNATSVTFNGKAATFDAVSDGEIDTTVPAGAPAGPGAGRRPASL